MSRRPCAPAARLTRLTWRGRCRVVVPATGYCAKLGFAHFGAGVAVGFSGLAAGGAIGMVGDTGVRCTSLQPKLFVGMILILIFAEALGLYGLIVALVMTGAGCD